LQNKAATKSIQNDVQRQCCESNSAFENYRNFNGTYWTGHKQLLDQKQYRSQDTTDRESF